MAHPGDRDPGALADRLGLSCANPAARFLQPVSLVGPGFGPPVGRPLTAVFGAGTES